MPCNRPYNLSLIILSRAAINGQILRTINEHYMSISQRLLPCNRPYNLSLIILSRAAINGQIIRTIIEH